MIIEAKVKTNSKKREVIEQDSTHYLVHIKSLPEEGKANKELVKLLSKYFKKSVKLLKGKTSKNKLLSIGDGN